MFRKNAFFNFTTALKRNRGSALFFTKIVNIISSQQLYQVSGKSLDKLSCFKLICNLTETSFVSCDIVFQRHVWLYY